MKIIRPSAEILSNPNGTEILRLIERAGRVCYKSEGNINDASAEKFIENILSRGHESVIEHASVSARIVCDRGVTHEIVRHRIASYSQESTRYCNYSKDKFGNELTFIEPCFYYDGKQPERREAWLRSMERAEADYFEMLKRGAPPEEARSVLPNSLKTEIIMTANMREWRHFFKLRLAKAAHPQMREVAGLLLQAFKAEIPLLFDGFA
jgi:thymidylate synthase (FAD)